MSQMSQMSQMPPLPGRVSELPDVWEYHERRSRAKAMEALATSSSARAIGDRLDGSAFGESHPARWDGRIEGPGKASRAAKGQPLVVVGLALVFALLLLRNSYWQEETMAARPDEVYRVYSTMMSMMHQEVQPRKISSKPQGIFDLRAGLFTAYIVDLCRPGPAFEFMVDARACRAKLESFCESLRDATPNDPYLKFADRLYGTCMDAAENENGLAVPLLYGPVEQLWAPSNDFEAHDDWAAEFCRTVADCPRLLQLRFWSWLTTCAVLAGVLCLICSCIFFAVARVKQQADMEKRGLRSAVVAFLLFVMASGFYIYMAKALPLSELIRSESLFYFMLPEPQDQDVQLDARLLTPSSDAMKRWRSVLLSLTGALLRGLAAGDMSQVYEQLKESLSRAWQLSDVIFQRWLQYMRYALSHAPSERAVMLADLRLRLEELDQKVQLLNATEDATLQDLGEELHQQVGEMIQVNERATNLVQHGKELVTTVVGAWKDLHHPLETLVARVQSAIRSRSAKKIFSLAKDLALDEPTARDLKLIFRRLFETLPQVIGQVKILAEELKLFSSGCGRLLHRTRLTLQRGSRAVAEVLKAQKGQVQAELTEATQKILQELLDRVQAVADAWAPAANGRRLDTSDLPAKNASIPRLVQPLTKQMATPMPQIGSIFLEQVATLGNSGVRTMQEQQLCSWQMPSACTNLGLGFFAFVLLQVVALLAVIGWSR